MPVTTVEKHDKVRREIELAIKLFFNQEDPVGVYALSVSSFQTIKKLAEVDSHLHSHADFMSQILPETDSEFWSLFDTPYDFLKLAEENPDTSFETLDEKVNDVLLLLCGMYYILLKYPASAIINLYVCWALIAYHDYMKEDSPAYTFYNTMRDLIVLPDFTEFNRNDQLLVGKKANRR